ncbi:CYFA0S17e00936g1_1 [Cyberlindnera fabianii]|uniref:CYFA0S17e00936g1_1 n=1 Tax=Cyberlindnera fabianii TaxID=36022 RepID=A0A061B625_CYBFA|nr:CYFA0S17e00936g1_1 [Cyberlindnera fabianii]
MSTAAPETGYIPTETTSTEQVSAPEATIPSNKLYVGNLHYKTRKREIEQFFEGYPITDISMPSLRHETSNGKIILKPKGYAFVTFKSDQNLDDIIEKFDKTSFHDREITVVYPKPRTADEQKELASKKKKSKKSNDEKKNEEQPATVNEETAEETAEKNTESKKAKKGKKGKKAKKAEKVPFDQGVKSTNTLYLQNLEYSIQSKDVKEFFEQEGEVVKSVHVPFLNLPKAFVEKMKAKGKTLARKNKGYAFVTLELKEGETIDDKVEKFKGKLLNEREFRPSVAIDTSVPKSGKTENATTENTPEENAVTKEQEQEEKEHEKEQDAASEGAK